MKKAALTAWAVMTAAAALNPETAFPWVVGALIPSLWLGFTAGPRWTLLLSAFSSALGVWLLVDGALPAHLVGPWALYGLLPLVLWDKNRQARADYAFLDLHLWLDPATPLLAAHATSHVVKDKLMAKFPQLADVVIHIEPPPR